MRLFLPIPFILLWIHCNSQTFKLAGKVTTPNKKSLINATVFISETQTGAITDTLGNYSISMPKGDYNITYSHVGFTSKRQKVRLTQSLFLDIQLKEDTHELEEVEITGQSADHNVTSLDIGVSKLEIKDIKRMPAFMGEVDVVKSLLFLPGITSVGEGTSNVNVRGGSSDQNLILMEGTPIFNPSHLMGLLSVFNPDVVRDLTVYRGNIPAQYGGRASSVLDIGVRESKAKKIKIEGGVGLVANRALVESSLLKGKLSFILASRFSFPDYLFALSGNHALKQTHASFYDFTTRIDYRPDLKNKIAFFNYTSGDTFRPAGDSISNGGLVGDAVVGFQWKNQNSKLEWIHSFSEKFSFNLSGIITNYSTTISNQNPPENGFNLESNLLYKSVRPTFAYQTQKHNVQFGAEGIQYIINPGTLNPSSFQSSITPVTLAKEQAYEWSGFVSDEIHVSKWLSVMTGLRYSHYMSMGPSSVYFYDPTKPRSLETITDTTLYTSGQLVKSYGGLEPRFALNLKVNESSSFKIGYSRLRQYLQRITNTTSALPTDRWQPCNTYIRPVVSDQISLGYFRNFFGNQYEGSVEVYAKKIQNIIDYKDGANLLLNQATETALLQGDGRAGGVEFQLKKTKGRLTGWFNYTYSQTEILINGPYPEEKINNGKWYPANYNKPNILNISTSYAIDKRVTFSTNFTYSTGRPTTYPANIYYVGTIQVPNYTSRNQNKIPDYHRLDVSLTVEPDPNRKVKFKGTWIFSIYNVYARKNAYSVFTRTNVPDFDIYKLSIFGTIIPSITYNFKLN
jgi:hypothetical protein